MNISHEHLPNRLTRFIMNLDREQIKAGISILGVGHCESDNAMESHVRKTIWEGMERALFDQSAEPKCCCPCASIDCPDRVPPDEPPPEKLLGIIVGWGSTSQTVQAKVFHPPHEHQVMELNCERFSGTSCCGYFGSSFGFLYKTGHIVPADIKGDDLIKAAKQPVKRYGDDLDKFATEDS